MHYKVLSISADCKNCFSLLLKYVLQKRMKPRYEVHAKFEVSQPSRS